MKWLPGKVVKVCGPRTYIVHVYKNGKNRYVHLDHILPSQEEFQSEPVIEIPTSMDTQKSAVDVPLSPEKEQNGDLTHETEEIQGSQTTQQTPTKISLSSPGKGTQGVGSNNTEAPQRRYPKRITKAPDRLDL